MMPPAFVFIDYNVKYNLIISVNFQQIINVKIYSKYHEMECAVNFTPACSYLVTACSAPLCQFGNH